MLPLLPCTRKLTRKYSEIVWLPTGRTASTSTNADALTGLPNTYTYTLGGIFDAASKSVDVTDPEIRESILGIPRSRWLFNRPGYVLSSIFILQIGLFLVSLLVYNYRFM